MRNHALHQDLLACLRGYPPEGVDWERVIGAANRTLTTGTMAERIRMSGEATGLPDDVRSFLAAVSARVAKRNECLLEQLAEALVRLNGIGVQPILLKGVATCMTLGDGGFRGRILSDLDLMVPLSVMADATACLGGIGYNPETPTGDLPNPVELSRSRDVGAIDLHCQLKSSTPFFDFDGIEAACLPIRIGNGMALLPSPTFQVLVLILHDQLQDRDYRRGLIDLRHMLDIEALAKLPGGVDWDFLSSLFPIGYPRTALQTQFLTLRNLLDIGVPLRLTGGWWPRLQYRRRIVQANRPYLMDLLTLFTLALDPPPIRRAPHHSSEGQRRQASGEPPGRPHLETALSRLRRLTRPKAYGKL